MAQQERTLTTVMTRRMPDFGNAMRSARRISRKNPTMAAGIVIIIVMILVAIFASLLFTSNPKALDIPERLTGPSSEHWFGTDNVGRDVYSRTIYGTRVSLTVGFSVAVVAMIISSAIGLVTGYYRKADLVVMRLMDGLMSIPGVLLAIALMALLGGSVQNVIIALSVVETPRAVRLVRGSVLTLREQMYVDAARAMGAPTYRILGLHILPNTFAPLMVQGTYIMASAVLTEAYLSFLGAGPPPDVSSWGNVMAQGRNFITAAIWIIFFPGLFLTALVLAINVAGDGLRDTLDPRLRRRM
jgi:peptide/nickel transport system permease protein